MKQDIIINVEDSVVISSHGLVMERCPTCGKDREVFTTSSPLALISGEDRYRVPENVWRPSGITNTNEVIGKRVKLTIEDNTDHPNWLRRGVKEIVGFQVITE